MNFLQKQSALFLVYGTLCVTYLLLHYDANINPFLKAAPIVLLWALSFKKQNLLPLIFPISAILLGIGEPFFRKYLYEKNLIQVFLISALLVTYDKKGNFLSYALFFGFAGDMFLATTSFGADGFLFGLASFLAAHIFYGIIFYQNGKNRKTNILRKVLIFLSGLASGSMFLLFYPNLPEEMRIPVGIYIVAITTMVALALRACKFSDAALWGALLFFFSDAIIGINKFYVAVPYEHLIVMILYYSAQFLLFWGLRKT